ncbi:MAG TPA: hypothetical protein VGP13_02740 [Candidatus Paceibacterota bacterium]|jgi:hypothetical protein|nr:hypothetical protein [Candidatus Paceibacterota bacterium]
MIDKKTLGQHARKEHLVLNNNLEQDDGDLFEVMDWIHDYVDACYFLSISPLRDLRRVFPDYRWEYCATGNFRDVQDLVGRSDFIWQANISQLGDGEYELFVATRKIRRDAKKFVFAGKKKKSQVTTKLIEFAQSCNAEAIFCDLLDIM